MIPIEVVVPVFAAVGWFLLSMATLTKGIWSHYPVWFDDWARCPACSGTWIGAVVTLILGRPFLGFEARSLPALASAGLWCTFFVPLCAWALSAALRAQGESHGQKR